MIGLSITAAILLIGPITGGSVNPARTFAPYFVATVFGASVPWSQLVVYVLGPVIGALLAAVSYDFIARPGDSDDTTPRSVAKRAAKAAPPARATPQAPRWPTSTPRCAADGPHARRRAGMLLRECAGPSVRLRLRAGTATRPCWSVST